MQNTVKEQKLYETCREINNTSDRGNLQTDTDAFNDGCVRNNVPLDQSKVEAVKYTRVLYCTFLAICSFSGNCP